MTPYEPDIAHQQETEQLLRSMTVDPKDAVAVCEHCGWPFVIAAKDLACCRELKARRLKNPAAMSPRAGAVLCPVDAVLTYQDAVAARRMREDPARKGDIADEVQGLTPGTNHALFLDWLRKHGGIV